MKSPLGRRERIDRFHVLSVRLLGHLLLSTSCNCNVQVRQINTTRLPFTLTTNRGTLWNVTCLWRHCQKRYVIYDVMLRFDKIRPVFHRLYQNLPGRCLVCKHGSHVINMPKADWSRVKNKRLTATPC